MDKKIFENPANPYRIYRLSHAVPEDRAGYIDALAGSGFGGMVTNAAWHREKGDTKKYLCEPEDFTALDQTIEMCRQKGFGLWLYDEKGYPSGSADGLTLENHPEYEAHGFTVVHTGGADFETGETFEKIIYAVKKDGTPADFDEHTAADAEFCYAVRPVFEGSHAEKCGFGPRHYPNLMDKNAVAAFIHCTYDKYYESLENFDAFEAVFTDEPSLMSAYVNCGTHMEYAFLPWQDELPNTFARMHGISFYSVIGELFDVSERFSKAKLMFWQTVADMVDTAFFTQIQQWCAAHGIRFSGHCLLEECLSMHVPLYGNLMKCLKSFDYPGVDMLTGAPNAFRRSKEMQYAMAAKYVGSAARMTGKTEKVMVEICPLPDHNGGKEYSLSEECGTMDLIFMSGINHINSYLTPERLPGEFPVYADTFARAAYVLRGCRWNGKIGLYYPIETMQGLYHPEHRGVNSGAPVSDGERLAEQTMFRLYSEICESGRDFTIVDADWLCEAACEGGVFSACGLEISALVMPGAVYLDSKTRACLDRFEKQGGLVLWVAAKPEDIDAPLCDAPAELLKKHVDYGIELDAALAKDLFVSPYIKEEKRVYYLINSSPEPNRVTVRFSGGAAFDVWHNSDGRITSENTFTLAPYTSVFVIER